MCERNEFLTKLKDPDMSINYNVQESSKLRDFMRINVLTAEYANNFDIIVCGYRAAPQIIAKKLTQYDLDRSTRLIPYKKLIIILKDHIKVCKPCLKHLSVKKDEEAAAMKPTMYDGRSETPTPTPTQDTTTTRNETADTAKCDEGVIDINTMIKVPFSNYATDIVISQAMIGLEIKSTDGTIHYLLLPSALECIALMEKIRKVALK